MDREERLGGVPGAARRRPRCWRPWPQVRPEARVPAAARRRGRPGRKLGPGSPPCSSSSRPGSAWPRSPRRPSTSWTGRSRAGRTSRPGSAPTAPGSTRCSRSGEGRGAPELRALPGEALRARRLGPTSRRSSSRRPTARRGGSSTTRAWQEALADLYEAVPGKEAGLRARPASPRRVGHLATGEPAADRARGRDRCAGPPAAGPRAAEEFGPGRREPGPGRRGARARRGPGGDEGRSSAARRIPVRLLVVGGDKGARRTWSASEPGQGPTLRG